MAIRCPYCMHISLGNVCKACGRETNIQNAVKQLPIGSRLKDTVHGREYWIGAALGQGGFGITYTAYCENNGQRVAIKEYYPRKMVDRSQNNTTIFTSMGQESLFQKGKARFVLESQTIESLSDLPSVVRSFGHFEQNNTAYLVMEYLDGQSLKAVVKQNGPFRAQPFFKSMYQMMTDIDTMNQRGVIHRDIAPDNIILMPDGTPRLVDFGAARFYFGDVSMTVMLKKGFAPVEQYTHNGMSAAADVYALAATMYYCITGTIPVDSAQRQYGDALTPPSQFGAELSQNQELALLRAMELNAEVRTQRAAVLRNQLCEGEVVPKRKIVHDTQKKKGFPWAVVAAGAVVCAALGVGVFFLRSRNTVQPELAAVTVAETEMPTLTEAPVPETTAEETTEPIPEETVPETTEAYVPNIKITYSRNGHGISTRNYGHTQSLPAYAVLPLEIDGMQVTEIGDFTFKRQHSLVDLRMPDAITRIGVEVFYDCTSLLHLNMPDGITEIGDRAFYKATALPTLHFPESLTTLGKDAFYGCTDLYEAILPDGLETIQIETFYRCTSLSSVHLPANLKKLEKNAFAECPSLTSIQIPGSLERVGIRTFLNDGLVTVIIDEGVRIIDEGAFYGCGQLTVLSLPESLERIENNAFNGCVSLSKVVIPKNVTFIGMNAFMHCNGLTSVSVPKDCKIYSNSFPAGCTVERYE